MLRVATLNLWGWFADWPRRLGQLGEQLPPLDVDVYLLQEVVAGARGDQLTQLGELLGYDWTARVVAERRPHETEHEGVAILSRRPLHHSAVWPLPPTTPPRNRLEATVGDLRVATLHAAVGPDDERDRQIAALADESTAFVIGADLNTTPAVVRRLLGDSFADTLEWDEERTWPVDEEAFIRAWTEKLGEPPSGDLEPRRIDYVLTRGVRVHASGTAVVASDHKLIWADVETA